MKWNSRVSVSVWSGRYFNNPEFRVCQQSFSGVSVSVWSGRYFNTQLESVFKGNVKAVSVSVWSGRYFNILNYDLYIYEKFVFPSPFGVEGISTICSTGLLSLKQSSFRLRLEWKVFQLRKQGYSVHRASRCRFRLRLEWKVFQHFGDHVRQALIKKVFPSPFGVEGISTQQHREGNRTAESTFPSPFGVEGISTITTTTTTIWLGTFTFPSPFGVEGISTKGGVKASCLTFFVSVSVWSGRYFNLRGINLIMACYMFPSPFGVEGISTETKKSIFVKTLKFPSPFGVEGISTCSSSIHSSSKELVSVSVWSGRYFNMFIQHT